MNNLQRLQKEIERIEEYDEDDIPLGKENAIFEKTVEMAVEAADELIVHGSNGDNTNLITAEVALRMMAKVVGPLRSEELGRRLKRQHEDNDQRKVG
jgi:hypothetical protein